MNRPPLAAADSTSIATPEERVLAELVAELETAQDSEGEAVVGRYLNEHPHLADKIRELLRMRRAVQDTRPLVVGDLPERLGEFRIRARLRSGGMGIICEALEDRLNRRVAIKIIRRGRVLPEARDRFLREQQVLAQMHQTNIVAIFAAGEQGSLQYFVMPLIDGASLSQVVSTAASTQSVRGKSRTPGLAKLAQRVADGDTTPDGHAIVAHDSTTDRPGNSPGGAVAAAGRIASWKRPASTLAGVLSFGG